MADAKFVDENELIDLYFVTHHNHVFQGRVTRKWASDVMRGWYSNREVLRDSKYPEEAKNEARRWLQHGTIARNVASGEGPDDTLCIMAVAWEHVVGMYTRMIEPSLQEQQVAAMQKLANAAEKQIRGDLPGDEWKQGDDES